MSEIKIHRSLNHPNVVAFEHFFEDYENVYILLEMCSNQVTYFSELSRCQGAKQRSHYPPLGDILGPPFRDFDKLSTIQPLLQSGHRIS